MFITAMVFLGTALAAMLGLVGYHSIQGRKTEPRSLSTKADEIRKSYRESRRRDNQNAERDWEREFKSLLPAPAPSGSARFVLPYKMNVREEPDFYSRVVRVIPALSEITVKGFVRTNPKPTYGPVVSNIWLIDAETDHYIWASPDTDPKLLQSLTEYSSKPREFDVFTQKNVYGEPLATYRLYEPRELAPKDLLASSITAKQITGASIHTGSLVLGSSGIHPAISSHTGVDYASTGDAEVESKGLITTLNARISHIQELTKEICA